ncbi:MAG: hypothetical protein ACKV2T_41740 [Kofleriaceae bacterium]
MGFGISRRALSKKAKGGLRSLFNKAPDAREVGTRLAMLAKRMLGEAVRDVTTKRLTLELHPDASPLRILVTADGDLEVEGDSTAIGPAYHAHVNAVLGPVLDELDFTWDADEPDPKREITKWLAAELTAGATRVGVPAELVFKVEGAVHTAMGPRDRAWVDAVIADPARGADAFAWWDDAPGHPERAAALLAMWLRVPWREPLDREERDLMKSVDGALRAARKADPSLALPYAEWAELLEHLGADEDRIAPIRAKASGPATIGYRRHRLEVEVGAWTLEIPGSFVGSFEDERYIATDGDRLLELSTLTAGGEHDSQALLDIAPSKHEVIAQITEDERCGRAEAYADDDVNIVHGLVASAPEVAILTCKSRQSDHAWAIAVWQSLCVRR